MLFDLEAILIKDQGSLYLHRQSDKFVVKLSCKFGDLRTESKSVNDGITAVLHSYKVLSENDVVVDKTPF